MAGSVLLLCPTLFTVRNVLHSRLRPELRRRGFETSVLGQAFEGSEPDPEYAELTPPPLRRSRLGLSALHVVQRASFYRRHRLANSRVTTWWYRLNDSRLRRMSLVAVESLALVGSRSPFYQWQMASMARLKRSTWDLGPARRRLEATRPSLVVATSCINRLEEPFLMAARDLGIPTLGCVLSFDHLTDRSYTAECDYYAVWNRRMKEQLLSYHPVRHPLHVHITGTPQFDFHHQDEFRWSRAETLARLGLEPGDRYILYAGQTFTSTPTEPEVVRELARRCAGTPALRSHRIVLRVHPNDQFDRWDSAVGSDPRIVVSLPSKKSETFNGPDDQARLVSTLLHADVCLNTWSSMSLDAAAVDTPVVCVAFAGRRGTAEDRFCGMVYDTDYYRPIVESGGVRLARDMDQLVAETAAYVGDRARDRVERSRMAAEECGPLDGRNAERVAELIAGIATQRRSVPLCSGGAVQ